jgi:uncharacterized membrane protein
MDKTVHKCANLARPLCGAKGLVTTFSNSEVICKKCRIKMHLPDVPRDEYGHSIKETDHEWDQELP